MIRSFLLATGALTLILSLGSIVGPAQDYGVSPEQALELIWCFIPVTLAFVLPVGAVFAAATTYGRFASENEFDACRAGGISTVSMLYPVLCLGIIASILNITLNFYVVPRYIQKAEVSVKANIKQIVFRSIEKRGIYQISDSSSKTYITADVVDEQNDTLGGVNIIRVADGVVKSLITTSRAKVDFEQTGGENLISITAYDLYQADESGYAYSAKLPLRTKVVSLISDNIRFKELAGLKAIMANPMLFEPVAKVADELTAQIATEILAGQIAGANDEDKWFALQGVSSSDQGGKVLIKAGNCKAESRFEVVASDVQLLEFDRADQATPTNSWRAPTATLYCTSEQPGGYWNIAMTDCVNSADEAATVLPSRAIRNLLAPPTIKSIYDSTDKLAAARSLMQGSPSDTVSALQEQLNKAILRTNGSVAVEVNYRLVFGLGCAIIAITGALIGVILKNSHIMTSFGISVLPLAVLIVFIMMGKNLTKNIIVHQMKDGIAGIYIIWTGLLVIAVIMFAFYRRLVRT